MYMMSLSSRLLDIMLEEDCLSGSGCTTKIKASLLLLYMEEGEYKIQMGEKERERVCVFHQSIHIIISPLFIFTFWVCNILTAYYLTQSHYNTTSRHPKTSQDKKEPKASTTTKAESRQSTSKYIINYNNTTKIHIQINHQKLTEPPSNWSGELLLYITARRCCWL